VQDAVVATRQLDRQPGDLERPAGQGVDQERLLAADAQPLAVLERDGVVQPPALGERLDLGGCTARRAR